MRIIAMIAYAVWIGGSATETRAQGTNGPDTNSLAVRFLIGMNADRNRPNGPIEQLHQEFDKLELQQVGDRFGSPAARMSVFEAQSQGSGAYQHYMSSGGKHAFGDALSDSSWSVATELVLNDWRDSSRDWFEKAWKGAIAGTFGNPLAKRMDVTTAEATYANLMEQEYIESLRRDGLLWYGADLVRSSPSGYLQLALGHFNGQPVFVYARATTFLEPYRFGMIKLAEQTTVALVKHCRLSIAAESFPFENDRALASVASARIEHINGHKWPLWYVGVRASTVGRAEIMGGLQAPW